MLSVMPGPSSDSNISSDAGAVALVKAEASESGDDALDPDSKLPMPTRMTYADMALRGWNASYDGSNDPLSCRATHAAGMDIAVYDGGDECNDATMMLEHDWLSVRVRTGTPHIMTFYCEHDKHMTVRWRAKTVNGIRLAYARIITSDRSGV